MFARKTSALVLTLLSLLAASGCISPARHARPVSPNAAQPPTGVLVSYELSGDTPITRSGCSLKLNNVTENQQFTLNLKKDGPSVLASLPPGRYFGSRLTCTLTKMYDLEGLFGSGFIVEEGKISYIGKVTFEFTKNDLKIYRYAQRTDSQTSLQEALKTIPAAANGSLISGFTGKPITQEMIQSESRENFSVHAQGTNEASAVLTELLARLNTCNMTAAKQDPLRFGRVHYVAEYRNGQFMRLADKKDENALSEHFQLCIDNSLRAFNPPVKTDLEVTLKY